MIKPYLFIGPGSRTNPLQQHCDINTATALQTLQIHNDQAPGIAQVS